MADVLLSIGIKSDSVHTALSEILEMKNYLQKNS